MVTVPGEEYRRRLQQLDTRARRGASGGLRAAADRLLQTVTSRYLLLVGDLQQPAPPQAQTLLRSELVLGMSQLHPGPQDAVATAVRAAMRAGAGSVQTATRVELDPQMLQFSPRLDSTLRHSASWASAALARATDRARLYDMHLYSGVLAAAAGARQVAGSLENTAGWCVYRAAAEGVRRASGRAYLPRLWVCEDDACLHCLAYAGTMADPGQPFRGGETYYHRPDGSPRPVRWSDTEDPPLHTNCRCTTIAYTPRLERKRFDITLRRDAQRTVISGKVDASGPAKTRALAALLDAAQTLLIPRSEQRRARRRLEAFNGQRQGG